ncbi:lytic murein transglycosylase [Oceaniglobus ichthyenteri]|uniref:lytic murein transglycosylase n=1 Tax=Oceaniglobus ichthyenteri TaxID=2136177 RepID=UPI001F0CC22F|nr:lytic murein transglycosylase [Oceaniglobus ichthyenteri]
MGMNWLGLVAVLSLWAGGLSAAPVEHSPRPLPRAGVVVANGVQSPRLINDARDDISTQRPRARPVPVASTPLILSTKTPEFDRWLAAFRGRALAQGIRGDVFDAAINGITYDPKVIERDRNQSEFTKTIWDYLDTAVSDLRIANGKKALERQRDVLEKVEAQFGVEKEVVVAIWGLESAYGTFKGGNDIIGSLATLAFDARRSAFFESQLVAALKILQAGDVAPRTMTGSWAGAMGHTQFIPTSYLTYAVDFTGDGKRDIWGEDPADALASTAAYLNRFGWTKGQPWGVEVTLPKGFDYASANRKNTKLPSAWAQLGVVGIDGKPVQDHGEASVLLPAGSKGAAFLVFKNFEVIERYNTADAYVIGVGHLADRIKGGPAIKGGWPLGDRALTLSEREEMQRRLTAKGFSTKGIDGKIGPLTIQAVRDYQRSINQVPDGYASLAILQKLRS